MAEFIKGDVVVVPFPFSDLTQAKRRPALVIATLAGEDPSFVKLLVKELSIAILFPLKVMILMRADLTKLAILDRIDYLLLTEKLSFIKLAS